MANYCITGKLGSGKSLAAVMRVYQAMRVGRRVASNIDLFPEAVLPPWSRAVWMRLPDQPSVEDLDGLGIGNESHDEDRNGILVLDECATWLNAREWGGQERKGLIDWFLHARKRGWECYFIVQDLSLLDKQVRTALCEYVVYMVRLDRISLPVVGGLFRAVGLKGRMPRIHLGFVRYGTGPNAVVAEVWRFRGSDYYAGYHTRQEFGRGEASGLFTGLSPFLTKGRFMSPWEQLRPHLFGLGLALFVAGALATASVAYVAGFRRPSVLPQASNADVVRTVSGYVIAGGNVAVSLEDGSTFTSGVFSVGEDGLRVKHGGKVYGMRR